MKAIVFHGINDLRYEPDWAEPRSLKLGEARIASAWCGICGTDIEDLRQGAIIPIGKSHPESGRVNPEPMVTSRVYIEYAVANGFEKAIDDRNHIKILVTPDKKYLKP